MWLLLACAHAPPAAPVPPPTLGPGLSDEVARVVDEYPTDGSYGFWWPPDDGRWWGTTRDVRYLGLLLSPGDPEHRSHCVGLTWEVAMRVLADAAGGPDVAINALGLADMLAFRRDWFVREVYGAGAADAVVHAGVGDRVPLDQLRRGDFLQLWTYGGAGHSAVFDSWARDGDRVVGIRYWSTHPLLGGVGYWTDDFGDGVYGLDRERIFAARLRKPADWVPPTRSG